MAALLVAEESDMPDAWWLLGKEIDRYLGELKEGDRSDKTLEDYDWALRYMFGGLRMAKLTINPRKIGRKEIDYLRKDFFDAKTTQGSDKKPTLGYRSHMVKVLRLFLKWAKNTKIATIKVGFGDDGIRRTRWLTDQEAMTVKMAATGVERMVVHCELDLGMRRIEVLRLKTSDFQSGKTSNSVLIHGKGRYGGKHRTINWHPDTPAELEAYLDLRDEMVRKTRNRNPNVGVPDDLLVYERDGRLYPYSDTGIDAILGRLSIRTEIEFSNHDLRRTCGRMMYRAGVKIEKIARIFGHSDIRTTLKYLGLDHEDIGEAMQQYAQYQKAVVFPKVENIELEPEVESGPNRI